MWLNDTCPLWLLIFLSSCISVTIILLLLLTALSECFRLYRWNSYMNHPESMRLSCSPNLGLSRSRGRVSSPLLWWWVMSILLKISLELAHPFWVFFRVIVNSMFGGMRLIDLSKIICYTSAAFVGTKCLNKETWQYTIPQAQSL